MRLGACGGCGIRDVDRAEDVGLDALAPVALQNRHVLERRRVKHDVRLKRIHQMHDAVAVTDIRNAALDFSRGKFDGQTFGHRMKRGFRVFDDQET